MFRNILLILKGMAMGAADIVPGVSGGTIAFITGIYEQLLSSINAINFKLFPQFLAFCRYQAMLRCWPSACFPVNEY